MSLTKNGVTPRCPKVGPTPTLISRKEVDALYETLAAIIKALDILEVDYIVTGGSLLGAIRQHSLLFCDDDIDVTIIERRRPSRNDNSASDDDDDVVSSSSSSSSSYERVSRHLPSLLGDEYTYSIRPWEGGDKVRHKRINTVFVDIFTLRRYDTMDELVDVVGVKANGTRQSDAYVRSILSDIKKCAYSQNETMPLCPFWHFDTRKAVELWRREVYRDCELFPLSTDLKFGPLVGVKGPRMPVLLLKRAFGEDCFDVYYQGGSHTVKKGGGGGGGGGSSSNYSSHRSPNENSNNLPPLVLEGGTWEGGTKQPLKDEHYIPMQPTARVKRRHTLHNKERLKEYVISQTARERAWLRDEQLQSRCSPTIILPRDNNATTTTSSPSSSSSSSSSSTRKKGGSSTTTVYMDGIFDLFHVGHLEAIRQCATLGDEVVIGITGDDDAEKYKRRPIIRQEHRAAIIAALREVDRVVCPCPLVVTKDFMMEMGIDLVVHGYANEGDAERQNVFFEEVMAMGKFRRIGYYEGLSTTDIIEKIKSLPD